MIDICEVLHESVGQRASDVYLKAGFSPRMRVDGKLLSMDLPKLLPGDILDCVLKILDEEQRDLLEERGEIIFSYNASSIGRYRVSVYKSQDIASMVFHRVWTTRDIVNEFHIPKEVLDLAGVKEGLLVFAGNGGSGRTTGMAALVDKINENMPVHIMTMENPIEVIHESKCALVDQREAGCDYSEVVYGLELMDKNSVDVLVYEDKPDAGVIMQLCRLAEAGKLVILSTNGNQLPEVVEELTSWFEADAQKQIRKRLSKVLQAVVVSKQTCGDVFRQDYEVIRVTDAVRNKICYSM